MWLQIADDTGKLGFSCVCQSDADTDVLVDSHPLMAAKSKPNAPSEWHIFFDMLILGRIR